MNRFLHLLVAALLATSSLSAHAALPATCPTISVSPTNLPDGDNVTAYTSTVTSANGTAPVTMEVTSGVLPTGVSLTDNGDGSATFSGVATQTGTFEFTITATDANGCSGGRTYAPGFAKVGQTISFTSTAPAAATVGGATYDVTATATSGLPVAFTIDASASSVCSIAGSTVSFIGVGSCVVDANQAGDGNFNAAPQIQQAFAVGIGAQTISFTSTAPAAATVGGATYTATATASSGLAVTLSIDATAASVCTIAGSTVSFTSIGTCVVDANQAGNTNYTPAPQVQQSFAVGIGTQTITFTSTPPAAAGVGGPTYTVTATASSGLPVVFNIDAIASGVCSIAGSTVSFTGAGLCVIDANQAGNANYNPAPQAQQSFAVGKANQTISYTSTAPAAASVGGATYTVTATATSGLTVAFTIDAAASAVCSITGSTVSFIGVGSCVIDANQIGDANYNAAPQLQQSFAVAKGAQTVSFTSTAPAAATVGGATYNVTATASSGLTVTLTIDASASAVCTLSGATVSFIGTGNCVIDGNQTGNANYNAAPQAQQIFAVGKGAQTITFTSTAPAAATFGGPTYTLTATASSGLTVALTIDASASAVCSISGATVSFIGVGSCVIDANQAGDANYTAAPQLQQAFAVAKSNQTINFTSTAPAGALVGGPTYTATATATSGLTVALMIDASAAGVCSIAGSTVSFIGAGTCVIDANQAGNANYNAATQVQQTFAVNKNNQTINFTSTAPTGAKNAGSSYNVTATATSGLLVALSVDASASTVCAITGSTVSFIGAGTCVIDANQAGNATFNAAPQMQQSFLVAKGDQTISFMSTSVNPAATGTIYSPTATATSTLPVTLTINGSSTSGCMISGSTVTFNAPAGGCVIDANQAGNVNWNAAPQIQQSITVLVPANAVPDSHAVTGNIVIAPAAANGVLTNDMGTNIVIKSYGKTTGSEQTTLGVAVATVRGGLITLNADGSYIYDPPANFTGTGAGADSFKYVIDNALVRPSTGTVTLSVSDRIMIVATAGVGAADCKPATECTLAFADSRAAVTSGKDLVFVQSGAYAGATFSLLSSQALVGQKVSLVTALSDVGIALAADSVVPAFPASSAPSLTNAATILTLGGGNLIENFIINPSGGSAILGNAITNGANIHDITITGSGAANGINLTSGTSGTFIFSNLVITTGAGNAFSATGGGTVNVTTGSVPNTLVSATGTALNIVNTAIGLSNINFQSIAAGTAAGGPASGILLNNTGASGGLFVTGTGSAGSGGTIQNTSSNGISLTSVGGGTGLTDMNIVNTAGDGITAAGVKNFSCSFCNITNSGSSGNKDGFRLTELSGSASLTNVTVAGATQDACFIQNSSATLASLTVTGSSFGSSNNAFSTADSGMEVLAVATGGITSAVISGTTFANNFSTGLQSFAQDTAVIGDISVSASTFANNGAAAVDFDAGTGTPSMRFHFLNNLSITENVGPAVNVFSSSTATGGLIQGRIDGNRIGTPGVTHSGSTGGPGIRVFLQGVAGNITIVNNTVRETACSRGIDVETLGPAPNNGAARSSDIVITGNDVDNSSSDCAFPEDDIYLASDNQAGNATVLRAEVHTNKIKSTGSSPANTDYPFDGNTWMYFNIATLPSTAQLVNFGGHANANTEIATTQTSGTAGAVPGVTLISGPITNVP